LVSIVPCLGRLQIRGGILGVSHDDQSQSDEQGDLQKEMFNLNEKDNHAIDFTAKKMWHTLKTAIVTRRMLKEY
jgi:hypothetical protein